MSIGIARVAACADLAQSNRLRRLAPFLLLSLLLHAVLFWLVRLPASRHVAATQQPLTVTLTLPAAPITATHRPQLAARPILPRAKPATVPAQALHPRSAVRLETQPEATVVPQAAPSFDMQASREAVRDIVRDEARKIEQQIAAQEQRRANSPLGMMEQRLRLTGKEIRLANGMLKIETAAGTVCFQPVPVYARDAAGLYGIPVTCP